MANYQHEVERICEVCNTLFSTINPRQKYCCDVCGNKGSNAKIKSKYKLAVQNLVNNEWKNNKHGIKDMFEKLYSPTCQLCLSKENVVSKLITKHTDWRVIAPDSWQHLCQDCLDTIKSYEDVTDTKAE